MQRYIVQTLVGLVAAIAVVAWVGPQTPGGTTFLAVVTILLVNAVAIMIDWLRKGFSKRSGG